MSYDDSVAYLYSLQKHGIKFGLDNTKKLLSLLGNPQNSFSSIHIAGTNGKGSTSAMMASVLQAAGYRVGLFTSPHLVSFTERIRINKEQIKEDDVVRLTKEIRRAMQDSGYNIPVTFFEFVTAMGFLYFKRGSVDWGVIETGMGGRLDATNVLIPEVSVITSIGYDHKEFLGDTLTAIAGEKAGIIKTKVPVVTSDQEPDVMSVLEKKAAEKMTRIFSYGKDFHSDIKKSDANGSIFDYHGENNINDLKISVAGRHQAVNASLALKASEIIMKNAVHKSRLTINSIRDGLAGIKWPGRLEFISESPMILIDGAHNPAASEALAGALREHFIHKYNHLILVLGIMSDKDIDGIMKPLLPLASDIILTVPSYDRAARPQKLKEHASALGFANAHIAETVKDAVETAINHSSTGTQRQGVSGHTPNDSLIVITGSFYTIGEAREALGEKGILSRLRE